MLLKSKIKSRNKHKKTKQNIITFFYFKFNFNLSLVCHFVKVRRHEKKPSTNTNNVKTKATQKTDSFWLIFNCHSGLISRFNYHFK